MTRLIAVFLLSISAQLGATPIAQPVISGLTSSPDSLTIVASWQTQTSSSSNMACGLTAGNYTNAAADNGIATGVTAHMSVVAGLLPSHTYSCQVSSSNSAGTATATFSAATTALPASIPATGVSYSAPTKYNSIHASNQGNADTFYGACFAGVSAPDCYVTNDDTHGFTVSGLPTGVNAPISLVHWLTLSPLVGQTIQVFTNYGGQARPTGDDGLSEKDSGLFAMANILYMAVGRQQNTVTKPSSGKLAYFPQRSAQIIASADRGMSWDNFQTPGVYNANGNVTTPPSASMFGATPTDMGSMTFVMPGCADDGTLGYLTPCNRQDSMNAYIYATSNIGSWSGQPNDAIYVSRVARARMFRRKASDWQWFTGGDGSLDANWSSTQANAVPVITNSLGLGEQSVQFYPALGSYLLMSYQYPNGVSNTGNTNFITYTAPHPWGPYTLINTTHWPTQGYYNPVPLANTPYSGTAPTILFTDNFGPGGQYAVWLSTMTLSH